MRAQCVRLSISWLFIGPILPTQEGKSSVFLTRIFPLTCVQKEAYFKGEDDSHAQIKRIESCSRLPSALSWRIHHRSYAESHRAEHHAQALLSASGVNQSLQPFWAVKNSCYNGSNWSECLPRYQIEGKSPGCFCNWAQTHLLGPY